MAVSLKPEEILEVASIPVTNSIITAVVIALMIILFVTFYSSRIKVKPHSRIQLLIESLVTGLNDLAVSIMGEKVSKTFFPFIFTFFTLIILSNWFGLLPFVGSVGYAAPAHGDSASSPILVFGELKEEHKEDTKHESEQEIFPVDTHNETDTQAAPFESEANPSSETIYGNERHIEPATLTEEEHTSASNVTFTKEAVIEKPFFRSPSADLNFTLAMAIISFLLIQYAGLKSLGLEYLGKFFDYRVSIPKGWKIIFLPFSFIIMVFWRTLELVLELGKIISFTFRLFGNIFAGEVLLFVITTLTFGLATLPFLGLEIFVGFVQAIVFCFLTMVFIRVGSESHHGETAHEANAS